MTAMTATPAASARSPALTCGEVFGVDIGDSMADMSIEVLRDGVLAARAGVAHGFLTRAGGVSGGVYRSLNCGLLSGDARADVLENRRRAVEAAGVACGVDLSRRRLLTVRQVHGARVLDAETVAAAADYIEGDGIVSDGAGYVLGVLTADCCPVLLADAAAGVVGAAHCGWRGAFGGVLEAALEKMEVCGATRGGIVAALGPTIGVENYEVGDEFHADRAAQDSDSAEFFERRGGRWHFDVGGYVRRRLGVAGVGEVSGPAGETYGDGRFFSARRDGVNFGRMLSVIALV